MNDKPVARYTQTSGALVESWNEAGAHSGNWVKSADYDTLQTELQSVKADIVRLNSPNKWEMALENALLTAHLGTTDSFSSPEKALAVLIQWSIALEEPLLTAQEAEYPTKTMLDAGLAAYDGDAATAGTHVRRIYMAMRAAIRGEEGK